MSGRLGGEDLPAGVDVPIYTVPANNIATVGINICNRNSVAVVVRLALLLRNETSVSTSDYLEYDVTLCPNGVLERTGVVLEDGQALYAYSDTSAVTAMVWGWEESV